MCNPDNLQNAMLVACAWIEGGLRVFDVHDPSHLFFVGYGNHRDLHSFPTRRSSDLRMLLSRMTNTGSARRDAASSGSLVGTTSENRSTIPAREDVVTLCIRIV